MLEEYAADLAKQMGMKLSKVSVEEAVDCLDASLLLLASGRQQASALVYQSDLNELKLSGNCDRLDMKIRGALSRLQMMLEP